jgi:dTDP-4-dehydrorhamnose 3,5-epimerase
MTITPLDIPDLKLIEPKKFGDHRGFFSEVYSRRAFDAAGIVCDFVQDNHSLSAEAGTVRGLHLQTPPAAQAKLIRVIRGAILDVAVDIRVGSPWFGQHCAIELSAENWRQVFVPAGFAHGFCTLEPDTEVVYKVNAFYAPDCDRGILWNDPALGIDWRLGDRAPVLSAKDQTHPALKDFDSPFRYR